MRVGEHVHQASTADVLHRLRQGTAEAHRRIERQAMIRDLLSPKLTLERYSSILEGLYVWYAALEKALAHSGHLVRDSYSGCRHGSSALRDTTSRLAMVEVLPCQRADGAPDEGLLGLCNACSEPYAYISRRDELALDLVALHESADGKPNHVFTPRCGRPHVATQAPRNSPREVAPAPELDVPGTGTRLPPTNSLSDVLGILYVIEGATQGGRIIAPRVEAQLGLAAGQGTRYFRLFEAGQWRRFRTQARTLLGESQAGLAVEAARQTFTSLQRHLDHWSDFTRNHGFPRE